MKVSATPEKGWIQRTYQDGDEVQILSLFQQVFQKPRSMDHWNWQFKRNPYGSVKAVLAFTESGELVGQFTAMPVHLNFRGDAMTACQGLDSMVRPDFQGKGILTALARYCHDRLWEEGARVAYGAPNRQNYIVHARKLDYKRIMFLTEYRFRVGAPRKGMRFLSGVVSAAVRSRLDFEASRLKRKLRDVEFHRSQTVPDGYDKLWDSVRWFEVLSLWKDRQYFQWRYDQNPTHKFEYFYLVSKGRIVALGVATVDRGNVWICELIVEDRNVQVGRFLINRILRHYAKPQIGHVRFLGHDCGFFEKVLASFQPVDSFAFVFHAIAVGENDDLRTVYLEPLNWTITFGDVDGV